MAFLGLHWKFIVQIFIFAELSFSPFFLYTLYPLFYINFVVDGFCSKSLLGDDDETTGLWCCRIMELLDDEESFVRAKAVNLLQEVIIKESIRDIFFKRNKLQIVRLVWVLFCFQKELFSLKNLVKQNKIFRNESFISAFYISLQLHFWQ